MHSEFSFATFAVLCVDGVSVIKYRSLIEQLAFTTKARVLYDGATVDCQLYSSAVDRLRGDQWLGDEVIYAYLLYVTRQSDIVVIDPLLKETSENFRIRQYPLRERCCYVPLHMRRGTHWALGVFNLSSCTVCVYDSYAYKYDYSSDYLERNEPLIRCLWAKITDLPIERMMVANGNFVHSQTDGSSCGVFTCIYGERLANNIATKSEEPTQSFVYSARRLIEHRLRTSFTVSEVEVAGAKPLPRIYDDRIGREYSLTFEDEDKEMQTEASEEVETSMNSHEPSHSRQTESSVNASKLAAITIEELMFVHQVAFRGNANILLLRTNLEDSAVFVSGSGKSPGLFSFAENNKILIVLYINRFGFIAAALFRSHENRQTATIIDFHLSSLDVHTRNHLRSIGRYYGFYKVYLHMCASCVPKTECTSTAATAVSYFIHSYHSGIELGKHSITTFKVLEEHRESIKHTLSLIPSACSCGNLVTVVVRMWFRQMFAEKKERKEEVIFVDAVSTDYTSCLIKSRAHISSNTLVILYNNDSGDLCSCIVNTHRMRSTAVIFDFSQQLKHHPNTGILEHIVAVYGYENCRFTMFSWPSFIFVHRDEFAAAVSYCLTHSLFMSSNLSSLSQYGLHLHIKYLHRVLCEENICGIMECSEQVSVPIVNYEENKDEQKLPRNSISLHLGNLSRICRHCSAVSFSGEPKSLCCNGGTCLVPEAVFSTKKDPLLKWLWDRAQNDEKLYSSLRAVNNLIAFAGLSMHLREFKNPCGQVPLVVQGSVDVGICHLNPDSDKALYAQLYICDDFKVRSSLKETILQWKMKIDYQLIEKIIAILRKNNVIAQCYKSMYEVYLSEMSSIDPSDGHVPPKVLMNIKHKRELPTELGITTHEGRLNIPRIDNQVAAIYVCRNGLLPSNEELDKGLRVYSRGGKSVAAHFNNNIDAMSYPLYFPRGEQSFIQDNLPKRVSKRAVEDFTGDYKPACDTCPTAFFDKDSDDDEDKALSRKFLSRGDFYRFVLSRRGNLYEHRFFGSGKLLSQFVIHVFTRIEADRLSAIGSNTTEIRSSKASSLYKFLDQQLEEKGLKLGKLVNLPQYFIGSRLWYDQLYHNAMAVAQRVGKPDLFITFTGNQDWPEIRENLVTQFDSWITDPLLCARVFRLRLQSLIKDLIDKQLFGEVTALQYSIEYQKRGMPHAHILLTLSEKLNTPEKIDKIISAEIPEYPSSDDPQKEQKALLYRMVSRFMIHGPCKDRPELACRAKNADFCDKRFPKPFRETTELTEDGYPLYRRRDSTVSVPVGKKKTTEACNRDVIPYNASLLLRYQCHINVECCCSIMAFKYIFKYIYKGPDQIVFDLLRDDEPLQPTPSGNALNVIDVDMRNVYVQARYLSHIEAAYRLLEFPMQYNLHTIFSLTAHLPGEQPVYFKGIPQREIMPTSRLLAYFALMKNSARARHLTWIEVAEQYRYDGRTYKPFKRGGRRIARIWPVNPKMSELYALRKLLIHTRGASSFEDLRCVKGKLYETFMEAAQAAGYIETEKEWEECLKSACETSMPPAIRRLYAQILLYCRPTNSTHLWEMFKHAMRSRTPHTSEDDDLLDFYSLDHISSILARNGSSLDGCGLKTIRINLTDTVGNLARIRTSSPECDVHEDQYTLTSAQQHIVDTISAAANTSKTSGNKLFYINGKAGCGKTHTLNALISVLRKNGKKVLSTASTGIAATLLKDGRTAHSLFRLPYKNLDDKSTADVDASSALGQELNAVEVIVWDEISMQSRFVLQCVERLLRDVASPAASRLLFGGVTMVLGGDWCQFLPVLEGATRQHTVNITFKRSPLWKFFRTFTLDENLRLSINDQDYASWLLDVGLGKNFCEEDNIVLPLSICMPSEIDIINWMYGPDTLTDTSLLASVVLLTVRNCDAEELNLKVLEKLPGTCTDLIGIDTPHTEEDGNEGLPCDNEEYFHKLMPSSLPPYVLHLKPGSIVMLLRNLDVSAQLCNGTRLVIVSILCDNKLLYCQNLSSGGFVFITRMHLDHSSEKTGIAFRRFQFPLRLAFCMTINKSQGQTFNKVGVILRTPSFAHGSTYVALSRCTTRDGLKVTRNWVECVPLSPKIRNVVYEEIL